MSYGIILVAGGRRGKEILVATLQEGVSTVSTSVFQSLVLRHNESRLPVWGSNNNFLDGSTHLYIQMPKLDNFLHENHWG